MKIDMHVRIERIAGNGRGLNILLPCDNNEPLDSDIFAYWSLFKLYQQNQSLNQRKLVSAFVCLQGVHVTHRVCIGVSIDILYDLPDLLCSSDFIKIKSNDKIRELNSLIIFELLTTMTDMDLFLIQKIN